MADKKEEKPIEAVKEVEETKPAEKKKGLPKGAKIAIIVAGVIVALLVWGGMSAYNEAGKAAETSDAFLNAMQAADGKTAYDLFSSKAKEEVPEDEFIALVAQVGPILNNEEKKTSTEVSSETGTDPEATIVYEVEGTDGVIYEIGVNLVKEDGEWLVLNFDSDTKEADK